MNESRSPAARLALLLALSLAVAGCQSDRAPPPLDGATMGGDFTLTDQNGRRVSEANFAGKYRLVYFGYAYCPDICPVDLQTIGAGLRQFETENPALGPRVQPIFITVDPARDTPETLRSYVANFHPRLIGLTGSPEEIARVARAYGVYFQRDEPPPGATPRDYLVDHSRTAVLYGPDGKPIAMVPFDQGPGGVAAELKRWVQ